MRNNRELDLYSNPHPEAIKIMKSKIVYRGWQNVFAILRNPNPEAFDLINFEDLKRENPKSKGSIPYWNDFWRYASAHPGSESLLFGQMAADDIHRINIVSAGSNPCPSILERLFGATSGPIPAEACHSLSNNPAGFHFLLTSPDLEKHISGESASRNPSVAAGEWLKRNPKKVDFTALSENPAPWAVEMLRANPTKINYSSLAKNTNADALALLGGIIPDDPKFWRNLSSNSSPVAIELLRANPDKIHWGGLMINQSVDAMRLLAKIGPDSWSILSMNPAIFEEFEVESKVEQVDFYIEENDVEDDVTPPKEEEIRVFSDDWEDENYCIPTI